MSLYRLRYAWPRQGEPGEVDGCAAQQVEVGPPGRWTPSPQVGVSLVGSRLGVAAEVSKVKWGLAAEAGFALGDDVKNGWVARVEARRGVTRGYWGVGMRVTKANDCPHLGVSGALELPPLKRHPVWFVIEAALPRVQVTTGDDLTLDRLRRPRLEVSAGVRFDLVRVRR